MIELHPNLGFIENRVGKTHMVQDSYRILSFKLDSWFKLQGIELGFRTNPNKSWCLGCVWVITHILELFGNNSGKVFEDTHVMKDELSKIEISR